MLRVFFHLFFFYFLFCLFFFFFFQAEDGIRDWSVTGVQTCALPIYLSVLCGHSKGNLILAEALEKIVRNSPEDAERLQAQSHIITLSAVIKMPDGFKKITDVLGSADPLGYMNSRRSIAIEKLLRGVGHHTNTEFPDIVPRPLDVTATLKDILYTE